MSLANNGNITHIRISLVTTGMPLVDNRNITHIRIPVVTTGIRTGSKQAIALVYLVPRRFAETLV
jgi:hypothetical protein